MLKLRAINHRTVKGQKSCLVVRVRCIMYEFVEVCRVESFITGPLVVTRSGSNGINHDRPTDIVVRRVVTPRCIVGRSPTDNGRQLIAGVDMPSSKPRYTLTASCPLSLRSLRGAQRVSFSFYFCMYLQKYVWLHVCRLSSLSDRLDDISMSVFLSADVTVGLSLCLSLSFAVSVYLCLSLSLSLTVSLCLRFSLFIYISLLVSMSLSLCVYLFLCLCLFLSFALSLSLCLFVSLSICLSVSLSLCLFVSLSLYLSFSASVSISVPLSICLSVCLSVCLFVCLSVCLFLSVCLCLSMSVSLSLSLSLSLSIYLSVCLRHVMTTLRSSGLELQTAYKT